MGGVGTLVPVPLFEHGHKAVGEGVSGRRTDEIITRGMRVRYIEPTTEHEMVALFLRTEIRSERFSDGILSLLARDGMPRNVVEAPEPTDTRANAYRAQLLGEARGYRQQRGVFENFPADVAWYRAAISRDELARVRYIDYSYWNELSGGSRLASCAARNIRANVVIYDVPNDRFWAAARAIRDGIAFPELILVGTSPDALIVLEGHLRLTAYLLAGECVPDELPVLMGLSPDFAGW